MVAIAEQRDKVNNPVELIATPKARFARVRNDMLREIAGWEGLDANKLILGNIVTHIYGDDSNAFHATAAEIGAFSFDPSKAEQARVDAIERLNWQANTPELDEDIRTDLAAIEISLSGQQFLTPRSFTRGYGEWEEMRQRFLGHMRERAHLRELCSITGTRYKISRIVTVIGLCIALDN